MARRGPKIALATTILGAGLSVALLFLKDRSELPAPAESANGGLVLRKQTVETESVGQQRPLWTGRIDLPKQEEKTASTSARPESPAPQEEQDSGPPPLTPHYEPAFRTHADNPARPEIRTHRISDGDTLAGIAAEYLGAPERGGEIYRANKHVLGNPNLLPIGAEIQIPTSSSPPAQANYYEAPLVPVRPLSTRSTSFPSR